MTVGDRNERGGRERSALHLRWHAVRDPGRALRELAGLRLNYDPTAAGGPGWHHDLVRHPIGQEDPGDPQPGGPWEVACRLVHDYEFVPPSIIRGYFHASAPLEGRDMLLVGRFGPLRFPLGVRVDAVVDETRGSERVWGWSYRTLEHHLERGRLVYEVVKDRTDGRVEFVLTGVSQRGHIGNPVVRLGFTVFGRWTQRRFYRVVGRRLTALVGDLTGPSPAPWPTPRPVEAGADDDVVTAPTPGSGAASRRGPRGWPRRG